MIGIDAHVIGTRAGGNESYIRNLLRALSQFGNPKDFLAFIHAEETQGFREEVGEMATHPLPLRSSYLRVPLALPWLAKRTGIELLHVQYTAPPWCPCPYVVSMHDIVALRLPASMPFLDRHRLRRLTPRTLDRAAQIFVLTEAIRDDIVKTYQILPERLTVVQPAIDPIFRPIEDPAAQARVRERYRLPEEFVLYIGLIQPRKNLARLAEALARLHERGLKQHLVIAGRRAWLYEGMLEQIERLRLGDYIHFTGYVAREDLPVLLSCASVFAYISLYEGFGIPVLEALACGVPTLASTDPALVEVAGGAALHAASEDVGDIAAQLERLLTESPLRARLSEAGPRRAAAFTLQRMARQAMGGYARALGHELPPV